MVRDIRSGGCLVSTVTEINPEARTSGPQDANFVAVWGPLGMDRWVNLSGVQPPSFCFPGSIFNIYKYICSLLSALCTLGTSPRPFTQPESVPRMHSIPITSSGLVALFSLGIFAFGSSEVFAEPGIAPPERQLYEAVADDIYLQEIGEQIATQQPVTALAVYQQTLYAVVDGTLHSLQDGKLQPLEGAPQDIQRLFVLSGDLWGTTHDAVYRYHEGNLTQVFAGPMADLCLHLDRVHGATRNDVYRFEDDVFVNIKPATGWLSSDSTVVMADGSQVLTNPVSIGPSNTLCPCRPPSTFQLRICWANAGFTSMRMPSGSTRATGESVAVNTARKRPAAPKRSPISASWLTSGAPAPPTPVPPKPSRPPPIQRIPNGPLEPVRIDGAFHQVIGGSCFHGFQIHLTAAPPVSMMMGAVTPCPSASFKRSNPLRSSRK